MDSEEDKKHTYNSKIKLRIHREKRLSEDILDIDSRQINWAGGKGWDDLGADSREELLLRCGLYPNCPDHLKNRRDNSAIATSLYTTQDDLLNMVKKDLKKKKLPRYLRKTTPSIDLNDNYDALLAQQNSIFGHRSTSESTSATTTSEFQSNTSIPENRISVRPDGTILIHQNDSKKPPLVVPKVCVAVVKLTDEQIQRFTEPLKDSVCTAMLAMSSKMLAELKITSGGKRKHKYKTKRRLAEKTEVGHAHIDKQILSGTLPKRKRKQKRASKRHVAGKSGVGNVRESMNAKSIPSGPIPNLQSPSCGVLSSPAIAYGLHTIDSGFLESNEASTSNSQIVENSFQFGQSIPKCEVEDAGERNSEENYYVENSDSQYWTGNSSIEYGQLVSSIEIERNDEIDDAENDDCTYWTTSDSIALANLIPKREAAEEVADRNVIADSKEMLDSETWTAQLNSIGMGHLIPKCEVVDVGAGNEEVDNTEKYDSRYWTIEYDSIGMGYIVPRRDVEEVEEHSGQMDGIGIIGNSSSNQLPPTPTYYFVPEANDINGIGEQVSEEKEIDMELKDRNGKAQDEDDHSCNLI